MSGWNSTTGIEVSCVNCVRSTLCHKANTVSGVEDDDIIKEANALGVTGYNRQTVHSCRSSRKSVLASVKQLICHLPKLIISASWNPYPKGWFWSMISRLLIKLIRPFSCSKKSISTCRNDPLRSPGKRFSCSGSFPVGRSVNGSLEGLICFNKTNLAG